MSGQKKYNSKNTQQTFNEMNQVPSQPMESDPPENLDVLNNLTEMNFDCLEKIFMYLPLNDLINIFHTNKTFQQPAEWVFTRKYGSKIINLDITAYQTKEIASVKIADLRTSLRLLRSFGHLIEKLIVKSSLSFAKNGNILNLYINEYCADSVIYLRFRDMAENAFDGMQKVFSKATTVSLLRCSLGSNWQNFNLWFPKMRRFQLMSSDRIAMKFPHLLDLTIFPESHSKWREFENVSEMLQLNPQLRNLTLPVGSCERFFKNSFQDLQSIEYLEIVSEEMGLIDYVGDDIRLEKLKTLKIHVFNYQEDNAISVSFPFLCKNIEKFSLKVSGYELNIDLGPFFAKHPAIKNTMVSPAEIPAL